MQTIVENTDSLAIFDAFTNEVRAARGIEAAIYGLGLDPQDEEMRIGVLELHQAHIGRLEEIKLRIEELFGINRGAPQRSEEIQP
jgi:hypothetical protein